MLELEHGFRIVDVHARLEPDEARRADGASYPERLEREFLQAGVVRALVFPTSREGSYLKANNAVARMSVDRPFVAGARVRGVHDPGGGAGTRLRNIASSRGQVHTDPDDIEQFGYDDRFAAFKLDPPDDGLPDEEVLEAMESVGLPVLTYGGRQFPPSAVARTLLDYDFPLVVAHFGGHPLDSEMMHRAVDMLDRSEGCYLDTSLVRLRDPLERAIIEHPDRVFFGSGAPAAHPSVAVMEILTLDVPEDAMRRVFSRNAARVVAELAP